MNDNYQPSPHSEVTERATLGAVLLDNELAAIITAELSAEDFYLPIPRNAFLALRTLHETDATTEINSLSLAEQMRRDGFTHEGIFAETSNFTHGLPRTTSKTLKGFIETLRQKTALRQLAQFGADINRRALSGDEAAEAILTAASLTLEETKRRAKFGATALRVVNMADVAPETVTWLWHPYIPKGKLTLIEGDGGIGKSWLSCAIACAVSNGRGLPNSEPFEAGNVLMLSAEDGLGDTLRPRLDAVGADVSRIYALAEPLTLDAAGLLRLEAAIIEHAPQLVIVDPLFAFTGGKVDIHRANEARAVTAPIAAMAERHGCAIVAVRHLNKARGGGNAGNAGIGSVDFYAAARSVLLVGKDPDDESKRALVQIKNNLAPHGKPQGYKLEAGAFFWTGESTLTAGRILSLNSDENERSAQDEAVEFLRDALADGERDVAEVTKEARQYGVADKTLRRAREQLGIRARRVGAVGSKQKFYWALPQADDAQDARDDAQENNEGHYRVSEASKADSSNGLADDAQVSSHWYLHKSVSVR